jgi:UDP-glucose 4-epimerase
VTGNDYDTPDGTGVRDYIHVVDLARGHVAAIDYVMANAGAAAFNLGTGKGTSVLELIAAFEAASGVKVNYKFTGRRPGDLAVYYASAEKAREKLGWQTEKTVADACRDSWNWQNKNPKGF